MTDAEGPVELRRVQLLLTFSPLTGEMTPEELEPYVGGLDQELVAPIADYLDNGAPIFAAMGSQYEALHQSFMVPVGTVSDGTNLWREWAALRSSSASHARKFVERC